MKPIRGLEPSQKFVTPLKRIGSGRQDEDTAIRTGYRRLSRDHTRFGNRAPE